MANLTIPDKTTGSTHYAAEYQAMKNWMNNPQKALGPFTPAMTFDTSGVYSDYTLSSNITISAGSIINGISQVVKITQPVAGTYTVSFGTNVGHLIGITDGYTLPEGDHWFYMESIAGLIHVGVAGLTSQTIIVMQDNFSGSVIDTSKWTVTDPADGVTISQNNELIFTIDGTVASSVSNNIASNDTIIQGAAQFTAGGTIPNSTGTGTRVSGLGTDTDNMAQIYGSGGLTTLRILVASVTEYSLPLAGVNFLSRTWKITIDSSNNIKFWYLSAPNTWTQEGTTQNFNVGTNKFIFFGASGTSPAGDGTMTIDNVYLTSSDYSTSNPT